MAERSSMKGSSSEWSQASIEGEEHEEVTEISEEELLQILDGQEPPLQVCRRLFLPDAEHAQLRVVTHAQMLQLQTTGIVIDDGFLPIDEVEALRLYAIQQHQRGGLQAAREVKLGNALQAAKAVDLTARDDHICWATHELRRQSQALDAACLALESLHADLKKVMALSSQPAEFQLALYPQEEGGCQYVKHRDALPTDDHSSTERKVTAILYTSTGWQQQDGGMLRLWQPPGTHRDGSAEEIDIEPLGGRLVLFLSGAVDHAVQPSQAVRVALTAWMA